MMNLLPASETARNTSAWWSTRHTLRQYELYADHFSELFVLFTFFVLGAKNFSDFRWKLFSEFVITLFFVSIGTYWGKKWFLRKKYKFCNILGGCEENFGVVVNTAFTEVMGSLCRSFFLKYMIFYRSFTLSETFFGGLSLKPCQQGCNHCILCVRRDVLRKSKKWKKWIFRKKYKLYILHGNCKGNFGEVVTTALTETIGSLCRPFFRVFCFFNVFLHWTKQYLPFVENSSASS